jgi:hypothetical protein
MQGKSGFQTQNTFLAAPQPQHGKVLMLASGKVYNPVDTTADAADATVPQVFKEQLRRISGSGSLNCREVPLLSHCGLVEAVPARFGGSLHHA